MTYSAIETSAYSGNPVELYEFRNGTAAWRYTSADHDASYLSNVFASTMLKRSEVTQTQELNKNHIMVTVPADSSIAQLFQFYPPTAVTTLTVFRMHESDGTVVTIWMGRVLNSTYTGSSADLHCEPLGTSIVRSGLRRHYQRECPHVLYGRGCWLNEDNFKVVDTVVSMSGLTVTLAGNYVANRFAGGKLTWMTTNGQQVRFITGSSGNTVNINFPVLVSDPTFGAVLPNGTSLNLYPGCAHTMTDCGNKFNNLINYGGFGFIPLVNPFGNTTLY